MESGDGVEGVDDETQDSEVLDVIPVQLEESYEAVGLPSPNSSVSRGKYYKQTYRPAWEQMPDFRGWLRGVSGEPTRAYCTYCQKTLHAHRLSLLKHTCTIRHQKAAQIHNSKKSKANNQMEHQGVHVLQEEDIGQGEIETEEGETIEYAEVTSEVDDEDHMKEEGVDEEEEEDEIVTPDHVSFEKHGHQQGFMSKAHMKPPISTHVLDSARGCPVSGLQVSLYKLIDGRWTYINEGLTNVNGKFSNFLDRDDFTTGRYKLHFDVDRYFEARKQEALYPFIEIIFDGRSDTETYHIPVILSPFGYSTYKAT